MCYLRRRFSDRKTPIAPHRRESTPLNYSGPPYMLNELPLISPRDFLNFCDLPPRWSICSMELVPGRPPPCGDPRSEKYPLYRVLPAHSIPPVSGLCSALLSCFISVRSKPAPPSLL